MRTSIMLSSLVASCLLAAPGIAAETYARGKGPEPGIFQTPVANDDLLSEQDRQWVAGELTPVESRGGRGQDSKTLWTRGRPTSHAGVAYGKGSDLGQRHLMVVLARSVPVGTVVARGNGSLSVLRSGIASGADPSDESQWLAAKRLDGRTVTSDQGDDANSICTWVLPPGTTTTALRFSHVPAATDTDFAGHLRGAYVLEGRFVNVAAQARVVASHRPNRADRIIDGRENGWGAWDNGDQGGDVVVSPEHPVDVALAFPAAVRLRGIAPWFCSARTIEIGALGSDAAGVVPGTDAEGWSTITTAAGLHNWYPAVFKANWVDFGRERELGAIRLRMTAVEAAKGLHGHVINKVHDGRGLWCDEILALVDLGDRELASAILPEWPSVETHPPIAVPFHLGQPGKVTLVIENADGKRVRNLVADHPFPAGDNVAWWDGLDDSGRDVDAAGHGLYHVPGKLVEPGTYTVRGLVHPEIELRYELSADNAGEPPWPTADHTGGWGTNHTPASCATIVPAERNRYGEPLVLIGSYVAEGGHGLFWVGMDGVKRGGVHWVGGHWTGAQTLATDVGDAPQDDTACYVASGFDGEVRFVAMTHELRERILAKIRIETPEAVPDDAGKRETVRVVGEGTPKHLAWIGDLAARDGLLVATMPRLDELWVIDADPGRLVGRIALDDPSGVAFDRDGSLLATSGERVVRLMLDPALLERGRQGEGEAGMLAIDPGAAVLTGLDRPDDLSLDPAGNLVLSERGERHQVRVYSPAGTLLRSIGTPGRPTTGPYDDQHCNNPAGVAVDPQGRFWVTEEHTQPKRVSLWSAEGELERAWYGPSRYGGGGTLDPNDRTLFYNAGMAFRVDWDAGDVAVERVLLMNRKQAAANGEDPQFPTDAHMANGMPEFHYQVDGRSFFSNWHNSHPTNGAPIAVVWEDVDGELEAVAAMGSPWGWSLLKDEAFASRWPAEADEKKKWQNPFWFSWVDGDGDGRVQPAEVTIRPGRSSGITVQRDLAFVLRIDDRIVRFAPSVGSAAVRYDFDVPEVLMTGAQGAQSSGGDTYLLTADRRVFAYPPPQPGSKHSVGGGPVGAPNWEYPNMWPGLHPSHEAALPTFPGELIGPTRLIGLDVTPQRGDAGPLVFLNQNMGNIAVFSSDGLFIATLFRDSRQGDRWRMPVRTRGMRVDRLTLGDETFWPTVTQVEASGEIYLCTGSGSVSSLVRVEGLDEIRRFADQRLTVSREQLAACLDWQAESEAARAALTAPKVATVTTGGAAPSVDGDLQEWTSSDWALIDDRGTKANFNSNSKPYRVEAALRVVGDTLYAAWRSSEDTLTVNTAEQATAPFKTGAALDLMLGTDASATADRDQAVAGDLRLLITTRPEGKERTTWAVLYRAVVPGTAADATVPFSSPWRTITFDQVSDVSAKVQLARKDGDYEVAIPLAAIGWQPAPGQRYRGDLGVLRGKDGITTQRVYWSNKATGITADVPSEAMLMPKFWGTFVVE